MDGGNGEGKGGTGSPLTPSPSISPEERAVKRQEMWSANPDGFIHISELIIGTRVLPSGAVQCVVGLPNQLLLEISGTRIQYEINKILMIQETEARKRQVVPVKNLPGGIFNFVRNK